MKRLLAAACCAFGVNHFPDPLAAVAEMARVAPLVGLLTWERPEAPYAPKQAVRDAIARHAPAPRSQAGRLIDALGERVGSAGALRSLLAGAGLRAAAEVVTVVVPWPGAAAFTEYRLANAGAAGLLDGVALERVRRDAAAAIARLPPASLDCAPAWSWPSAAEKVRRPSAAPLSLCRMGGGALPRRCSFAAWVAPIGPKLGPSTITRAATRDP